jgi:hypothetical protein
MPNTYPSPRRSPYISPLSIPPLLPLLYETFPLVSLPFYAVREWEANLGITGASKDILSADCGERDARLGRRDSFRIPVRAELFHDYRAGGIRGVRGREGEGCGGEESEDIDRGECVSWPSLVPWDENDLRDSWQSY